MLDGREASWPQSTPPQFDPGFLPFAHQTLRVSSSEAELVPGRLRGRATARAAIDRPHARLRREHARRRRQEALRRGHESDLPEASCRRADARLTGVVAPPGSGPSRSSNSPAVLLRNPCSPEAGGRPLQLEVGPDPARSALPSAAPDPLHDLARAPSTPNGTPVTQLVSPSFGVCAAPRCPTRCGRPRSNRTPRSSSGTCQLRRNTRKGSSSGPESRRRHAAVGLLGRDRQRLDSIAADHRAPAGES